MVIVGGHADFNGSYLISVGLDRIDQLYFTEVIGLWPLYIDCMFDNTHEL